MNLSVIIPTYNEQENIAALIAYLQNNDARKSTEIIVSDGGSTDETLARAARAGARAVPSPHKGRAAQMNYGARLASGDIFYFVHADTYPPPSFVSDITVAVANGAGLGRYRTQFQSDKLMLRLNEWFTRFDLFICMGGDQTLFVTKEIFERCGGFNEEMRIMEEYEFCRRARQQGRYRILKGAALVSARKYDTNSWLRVQRANSKIVRMYRNGASQQEMIDTYKRLISYRKNAF